MIIQIADIRIKIEHSYFFLKELCKNYAVQGEGCDFVVKASLEDLDRERKKSEELTGKSLFPGACESIAVYRQICEKLIEKGCFRIHASVVSVDGEAYAFAGESGCGKSTQAKMWLSYFDTRAFMVNGDKPILKKHQDDYQVCGTPWCGKEGLGTNTQIPLKAVFFVEKADGNRISKMTPKEAVARLCQQHMIPEHPQNLKTFRQLLEGLAETVPCYQLQCNLTNDAVITAYEGAITE